MRHSGISRYEILPRPIQFIFLSGTLLSVILFILYWYSIPIFGEVLTGTRYYYLLYASLGFNIFMGLGATSALKRKAPRWFDYILSFTVWGIIIFCLLHSDDIGARLWNPPRTWWQYGIAVILLLISLEAGRRVAGWGFVGVLIFSLLYPQFADRFPGVLYGYQVPFSALAGDFAFGANGWLGLPAEMLGNLILPFFLFAGVVMGSGGGEFFLRLAIALAGRFAGGPAKVSVIGSAFFGSLSGSVIANIAGTGSFTIPAMKRTGWPPEYAAAIECCASGGGDTMPPIMGGLVFMMIILTGVEYADVLIAAVIPSFLYFLGLLVQVDSYAKRNGLKGLPKEEIPGVLKVLKEGWQYLFVLVFLTFGMVYMRWGIITPLYAAVLMLLLGFVNKRDRPTWRRLEVAIAQMAGLVNFGMAVFFGMGIILVGLLKTGMAAGLTGWIVSFGAGNAYLILLIGAVFSMIMGTVGLERSSYIFLAVTMCPAVVSLTGMNPIPVHLFVIFYAGYGELTPPVAVDCYVAASIANADPRKTMYRACRLGIVLFLLPWFFVLQPALMILGQPWHQVLLYLILASIGIWLMASGLEGYLRPVGNLRWHERAFLILGGFLFAFPEWLTTIVGAAVCAVAIIMVLIRKRALQPEMAT